MAAVAVGRLRCQKRLHIENRLGGLKSLGNEKWNRFGNLLLSAAAFACGALGLLLFRWTPTTDSGIFAYVVILVVFVAVAIFLFRRNQRDSNPK